MKFLLPILITAVAVLGQDSPCPLVSFLDADHDRYVQEAEELGYYADGEIVEEAIVADIGQEIYDTCRALADEVNQDNVKEEVAEFYNLDAGGSSSGGACWEDEEVVTNAQDVIFFDCIGLSGTGDGGGNCPLVAKVEADYLSITADAEEMGWWDDGFVDIGAIVADIGYEAYDACHNLSQEINEDNVAAYMRDFYGLDDNGAPPEGGPCWTENEDIVRESKQLVLFDCAFDTYENMQATTTAI